jgi:hypothetical protein
VHVTAADVSDRDGATELLRRLDRRHVPRLRYGWVDSGYRGGFLAWALARSKIAFEVVSRADGGRRRRWLPPGVEPPVVPRFAVVPRRWVVERTQSHCPQSARLDRWQRGGDHRDRRAAAPARGGRAGTGGPGLTARGRDRAMSGPSVAVPPRPARDAGTAAGSTCRWPTASGCCGS